MTVTALSDTTLPAMPAAIRDAEASKDIMRSLRHFHLGNPQAKSELQPAAGDSLPALLNPFRDSSRLRFDYPLFLQSVDEVVVDLAPEQLAVPLSRMLSEAVQSFAPDAEASKVLKDNLPWLERELRGKLDESEGPVDATPLLETGCKALVERLALPGESSEKLQADIDKLLEAAPAGGSLLAYGRFPAIHLLIHTIRNVAAPRHAQFCDEVADKARQLRILLKVEDEKSAEAKSAEKLAGSIGGAGALLDPKALSGMMGHSRGSISMSAERRKRIEDALAVLDSFKDESVLVRVVHTGGLSDEDWLSHTANFEPVADADPCAKATELFDTEAERLSKIFAAVRIAQLEIDDNYDNAMHDPWFAGFGWQAFSQKELLLTPAVVALEDANRVAGEGLSSFSRLLSSGRPVQVMARVQAHNNPGCRDDEGPFDSFRTELGYLGISHRQAFVAQSTAARHEHLIDGLLSALNSTRAGLHLINTGLKTAGREIALNAWLVAGAALEGRAHPFIRVNPSAGCAAADCVDYEGNPMPESDWPIHSFTYKDEDDQVVETDLAFTFADYSMLLPKVRDEHFVTVPGECESDDLVPVAEYLEMPQEAMSNYVPFIWAVDAGNGLHRLAVSRTLINACQDRLCYWRSLQEYSGARNSHVAKAITTARSEIQAAADAEIAEANAAHEQALADARSDAAGEVMGRLTDMLLGMDMVNMSATPAATPAGAPVADATRETAPAEEVVVDDEDEEEEIGGFEDPWIDTPLCTSCNDCLKVNPIMFFYNDANQALLGDLASGTYAQMVEAAELCPSKCIHPGKPWDQDEANLDELQQRAAPFN